MTLNIYMVANAQAATENKAKDNQIADLNSAVSDWLSRWGPVENWPVLLFDELRFAQNSNAITQTITSWQGHRAIGLHLFRKVEDYLGVDLLEDRAPWDVYRETLPLIFILISGIAILDSFVYILSVPI